MRRKSNKTAFILIALLAATLMFSLLSSAEQTGNFLYFPSGGNASIEDPTLNLALTAPREITGEEVSMTYTPSTYQISTAAGSEFVDLQIHDASLGAIHPDVENTPNHEMDLIFNSDSNSDTNWKIQCIIDGKYETVFSRDGEDRLLGKNNPCQFKEDDWSGIIRVFPGTTGTITMKTVWDVDAEGDGIADEEKIFENPGLGLINVFRFRTKSDTGTIGIAKTNTDRISDSSLNELGQAFRKEADKTIYESSLNWTTLYNTSSSSEFLFNIDVRGKDEVILFDKDADANTLYGNGKPGSTATALSPPDDTVIMEVKWGKSGENSLTYNPEWTNFNQINHNGGGFKGANFKEGDTNSYVGPSGDAKLSDAENNAIQWYKIDVSEHKADTITVRWHNFKPTSNGIAFASDTAILAGNNTPPDEDNLCELREDGTLDEDCCVQNELIRICADSIPEPETTELQKKNITEIVYTYKLKYIGENFVEDLQIHAEAPKYVDLKGVSSPDTHPYNIGTFAENQNETISITVGLEEDAPAEGTISTEGKYIAKATGMTDLATPTIKHYLGIEKDNEDEEDTCKTKDSEDCVEKNDKMSISIFSEPIPETEKLKQKGISEIKYTLKVTNIGTEELQNILIDSQIPDYVDYKDSPTQQTKEIIIGQLSTSASAEKEVIVQIESDAPDSGTISTKDKFIAKATGMTDLHAKTIRHFLGTKPDKNEKPCVIEDSAECQSQNDDMKASVFSDPAPETEFLVQKGISEITYSVKITNISDGEISNVMIDAKAPSFVDFKDSADADQASIELGTLAKDEIKTTTFTVQLEDTLPDEGTITTADKFFVKATDMSDLRLRTINHYLAAKPGGPGAPKCGTDSTGTIEACISSIPPNETKGMKAPESIEYKVSVKNVSDSTTLNDINVSFEPDAHTKISDTTAAAMMDKDGNLYNFVGAGRTTLITQLSPNQETFTTIQVNIQNTVPEHYTISTNNKIFVAAANHGDTVTLPAQKHHVGNGSEAIEVSRCYEFDGALDCSDTCKDIPPEADVIVRDLLKNIGGAPIPAGFTYFPPPLPSSFTYNSSSIRIFHEDLTDASKLTSVLSNYKKGIGGIIVSNDGSSFPPTGGISTAAEIPLESSASVFLKYIAPDAPGCFPREAKDFTPNTGEEFTEIELAQDCTGGEQNKICVGNDEGPRLTGDLTAVPSPDPERSVLPGDVIGYEVRLTNARSIAIDTLQINGVTPLNTSCHVGSICTDKSENNPNTLVKKGDNYYYRYSVRIDSDAPVNQISHPGHTVTYADESGISKSLTIEGLTHKVSFVSKSDSDFSHDISLDRRTVVNSSDEGSLRNDQADKSEIIHTIKYIGRKEQGGPENVIPYDENGSVLQTGQNIAFSHCQSAYSGFSERNDPRRYETRDGNTLILYRTNQSTSDDIFSSFSGMPKESLQFDIVSTLPSTRPAMKTRSGQNTETLSYTLGPSIVTGPDSGQENLTEFHLFMMYGGEIVDNFLEINGTKTASMKLNNTEMFAYKDGETDSSANGVISTTNTSQEIFEERWVFRELPKIFNNIQGSIQCEKSCPGDYCQTRSAPVYPLRWQLLSPSKIVLTDTDKDYITALSSVAWLKTRNGNIGFGGNAWSAAGTPNKVDLGDKSFDIEMKLYTPPLETNSDFLIYAPDNTVNLKSRLNWGGYVSDSSSEQGFVDNPWEEGKKIPRRGDAYDRDETAFPRNYYEDLLQREIYGKVIEVDSDRPAWINPPTGTEYTTATTLTPEIDTIYHIKGNLIIGSVGITTTISGSKARIIVDGNVEIRGNVKYGTNSGPLENLPSMRLHSLNNIVIHPSVTDVEMMMLAEGEFHSGRSDQQLRILGDVITYKAFWERAPLKNQRNEDEDINKPSELIVEDYRKYLLTPPGDKKLPDIGYMWREVNPSTGRPILESLINQ
ncbi:MAG: hypothetical protein P1V18_04065 [Candidatus Gracilibacteria bacterium]|nr:hypothetical protein [Candidatus Gracilibacteria bacterium]